MGYSFKTVEYEGGIDEALDAYWEEMNDRLEFLERLAKQTDDDDYESYREYLIRHRSGFFTMGAGKVMTYKAEEIEVDDIERAKDFIRERHRKWEMAIGIEFSDGRVIIGGYEAK